MKIVNSIMPVNDVVALAANGQKLRVAVTKTSAQGKAAQSATPNLMSFSTDENSVWFNGKKYGVYVLKGLENLQSGSSATTIQTFLGDFTYDRWTTAANAGSIVLVKNNSTVMVASVYADGTNKLTLYMNDGNIAYNIGIAYSTGSGYSISEIGKSTLISEKLVVNTLTSTSSNRPLSAAMGKKLQDEKLAKTDVVNNLTTTSTSKALSAAQGKALNDKISGLGNVYRVKGTKSTIEEVYDISANSKLGDVWNVTSAFTIGGKPYPANTNVVCIAEWSTSTTPQNNWDPLGGTVNLSTYVPKSDIVDNLSTSDSKKPLSAKQGLALATMITELEDNKENYQLLKTLESGTPSTQSEIDAILGPYSSFNAALNAGKIIHGIYKDGSNRLNTVAFSAFNDTTANRVRMYAMLDSSTMVAVLANHNKTNWVSATIDEGSLGGGITIE